MPRNKKRGEKLKNITWCLDALYIEFLNKEKDDDGTLGKIQAAREEVAAATFVNKYHSCRYCMHVLTCGNHDMLIELLEFKRDKFYPKNFDKVVEIVRQAIGSNCGHFKHEESK